jgi:ligand-binding sensor domain-containing protein
MKYLFFLSLTFLILACNNDDDTVLVKLPDNTINKIVVDKSGTKWIATIKGIVSFNGKTYSNAKLGNNSVVDLATETQNSLSRIWLASNFGATVYNYKSDNIDSEINYSIENGMLSNNIKAVGVYDSGTYFFGTSLGLSILHNNKWSSFTGKTRYENIEVLKNYEISDIARSKNGWVFVTTLGGGVSRFKYELDAVSGATTYNSDWAFGIQSDSVNTVVIVDDTCQWFGTNNGVGFHTSHYTKEDWIYYSTRDGLICDTVLAIAKDQSGNVWFGTPKGLSKFDGLKSWKNYTIQDGLIDNKINTIAVDIDNSVWFGTDKGISHFSNNKFTNYTK